MTKSIQDIARLLAAAHGRAPSLSWKDIVPPSLEDAYAIQDATVALLGTVAGWKVGAGGPDMLPGCAPMPAANVRPSGSAFTGPQWALRGIEVEAALRVGRDIEPLKRAMSHEEIVACFDAVLPVIEIVETRMTDKASAKAPAPAADLLAHGGLAYGEPLAIRPADLDLRTLVTRLEFDGKEIVSTRGGNVAQDVWRLVAWLVQECARRGQTLKAGQIITTGSCTGMISAPLGTRVTGYVGDAGTVELRL